MDIASALQCCSCCVAMQRNTHCACLSLAFGAYAVRVAWYLRGTCCQHRRFAVWQRHVRVI